VIHDITAGNDLLALFDRKN